MLLVADIHLDDKPQNEYRWQVFDHLMQHANGDEIIILGDLCDKADRHSAVLVNRLVQSLTKLLDRCAEVTIIKGNHDSPKTGEPFWGFLNYVDFINFYSVPYCVKNMAFLPYSANPREDWKHIDFNDYKVAFIHQTVEGATLKENIYATEDNLPEFPPGLKVYAGDLHIPHKIGQVEYIGAPHRVRFGDRHACRLLRLDGSFDATEIPLTSIRKEVFEVSSIEELKALNITPGDQARVRFVLPAGKMEQWPVEQNAISAWALENGVTLASTEAIIETSPETGSPDYDFDADPRLVMESFCRVEGVDHNLAQAGYTFLANHKGQ